MPWGLPDDEAHLVVPVLLVPPLVSTVEEPCHRGRSGSPAACLPSQMGSGDAIRSSAHDWGRHQQKGITSGFPIFLRLGLKCPEITLCKRYLRDTPTFPPTNFFNHPGFGRIHLDHLPANNLDTVRVWTNETLWKLLRSGEGVRPYRKETCPVRPFWTTVGHHQKIPTTLPTTQPLENYWHIESFRSAVQGVANDSASFDFRMPHRPLPCQSEHRCTAAIAPVSALCQIEQIP